MSNLCECTTWMEICPQIDWKPMTMTACDGIDGDVRKERQEWAAIARQLLFINLQIDRQMNGCVPCVVTCRVSECMIEWVDRVAEKVHEVKKKTTVEWKIIYKYISEVCACVRRARLKVLFKYGKKINTQNICLEKKLQKWTKYLDQNTWGPSRKHPKPRASQSREIGERWMGIEKRCADRT